MTQNKAKCNLGTITFGTKSVLPSVPFISAISNGVRTKSYSRHIEEMALRMSKRVAHSRILIIDDVPHGAYPWYGIHTDILYWRKNEEAGVHKEREIIPTFNLDVPATCLTHGEAEMGKLIDKHFFDFARKSLLTYGSPIPSNGPLSLNALCTAYVKLEQFDLNVARIVLNSKTFIRLVKENPKVIPEGDMIWTSEILVNDNVRDEECFVFPCGEFCGSKPIISRHWARSDNEKGGIYRQKLGMFLAKDQFAGILQGI
jgi:hypothetical protein